MTRFRFYLRDGGVVAEVEETAAGGPGGWRTVVELLS